ncbi:hypothetical protein TVAG_308480 [Trichomonas vaginalis G3]|uniref:Uncharacterized protein n=1 Tax=Trichomonas vaginalis (strain ATCC PRA-98 / G3) TaxID=412133 RepID=A2G5Z2_TRIV3|nr:hypothetical protein TVAGG3_0807980 [Trichomonas vaginalis G3]EAX87423.1 hypothetical protein TVAG_308480 [Trichomonas vaginalis G3]KAI5496998.1 hypothetical protein TVAGG3_0807980 [Trichomonas vaginalis G3]|eukprot:XP_001300353.1 hypothetical protein [Trichomonas vaginalis G3]
MYHIDQSNNDNHHHIYKCSIVSNFCKNKLINSNIIEFANKNKADLYVAKCIIARNAGYSLLSSNICSFENNISENLVNITGGCISCRLYLFNDIGSYSIPEICSFSYITAISIEKKKFNNLKHKMQPLQGSSDSDGSSNSGSYPIITEVKLAKNDYFYPNDRYLNVTFQLIYWDGYEHDNAIYYSIDGTELHTIAFKVNKNDDETINNYSIDVEIPENIKYGNHSITLYYQDDEYTSSESAQFNLYYNSPKLRLRSKPLVSDYVYFDIEVEDNDIRNNITFYYYFYYLPQQERLRYNETLNITSGKENYQIKIDYHKYKNSQTLILYGVDSHELSSNEVHASIERCPVCIDNAYRLKYSLHRH